MKSLCRILFCVMCVLPTVAGAAPVATTAGSNLTAYNPNTMGSVNNNQWNSLMNNRTGTANGPVADFGNCNALILRCATPKCAAGGCTSMDVTIPIVNGCVMDNATCKQYGDDLVQSIAAQIVANSNARAAQAAQNAAASAAAQSSQQMAQMQQEMNMQMQQMQAQMQQQNADTVAQLQAALAEQKQMAAAAQQQVADAQAAQAAQSTTSESGLTAAQEQAAARGVDADLLVREQVTGQIMSKLENAETALKALEATMKDVFTYAGCDSRGNNCAGPKRVKVFKQKAMGFFEPYNDVLDELYDALITAQAVGVDITDIYMMLNGSCNVWGEYLCTGAVELKKDDKSTGLYEWPTYNKDSCPTDGGKSKAYGTVIGGHECFDGGVIPPEDSRNCTLNRTFTTADEQDGLKRDWLEGESADNTIRIGCASSALESSALFRNRKKQASIDIETLEKMMSQDAPSVISKYRRSGNSEDDMFERLKYCAVGSDQYANLGKWAATKKLPNNVCMSSSQALRQVQDDNVLTASADRMIARVEAQENYIKCTNVNKICEDGVPITKTTSGVVEVGTKKCCAPVEAMICVGYAGGKSYSDKKCNCPGDTHYYSSEAKCMPADVYCAAKETMHKTDSKDGSCYDSCLDYCMSKDSGGGSSSPICSDKNKCEAKWNKDINKCECTVKN